MMDHYRILVIMLCATMLAACNTTSLTGQSFPNREQVSLRSADGETIRTYACQRRANAARAHRFADGEILEAQRRFTRNSGGGIASGLGVRAEVNAEISRISRAVEADYRCAYLGSRGENSALEELFG